KLPSEQAAAPRSFSYDKQILRPSAILAKGKRFRFLAPQGQASGQVPTVTAILPHARRAGRFNVVVDERVTTTLSLDVIERLRLAVGRPIDARTSAVADREASILATYDRALSMLAARARSSAELRRF